MDFFIPAKYEEPALSAAYTHIAAIQSAVDLVGKENVVVSFEFDEPLIEKSLDVVYEIQLLREEGNLDSIYSHAARLFNAFPTFHAMEFAKSQGLEIVGSDPGRGADFSSDSQERRDAEIVALGKLALQTEDTPKVVVHVGGSAHLVTLQGYPYNIDTSLFADKTQEDAVSPFEGIYGSQIFINSDQPVTDVYNRSALAYMRNPDNAMQLDPPGKMDTSDLTDIGSRVQDASREYQASETSTEIAPDVSTGVPKPK